MQSPGNQAGILSILKPQTVGLTRIFSHGPASFFPTDSKYLVDNGPRVEVGIFCKAVNNHNSSDLSLTFAESNQLVTNLQFNAEFKIMTVRLL